ncbi:hypothetical protein HO173_012088 [Letharia columbiana]|uniref:Protein kinase domain-containing protein n=1 Tax=Letharia columbiana TaxID=112416 RepID=A0A8H6CQE4_9LECA|nr:uncharacterized protein HO173_012088 [Letharia columbiana]KAF6227648.1 hypothetical protein HO173_012088 [Letharia columbiana]
MADPASSFEVDTVPVIPASWTQNSNTDNVFGWLRPMNEFARNAFHLVVDNMIHNPDTHLHERQFIHLDGKETLRSVSVSGSDDQADQEEPDQVQFVGAFKFSTSVHPKNLAKGWFIGTGRGKPEVDVVIGPPDSKWYSNKILGNHARLYIHKESCQTTVEALHSMEVSGSTGFKHIDQRMSASSKVLEDGHLVEFGRCMYLFHRGDAIANGKFEESLSGFMKYHHGDQWKAHPILSAPSTGSHLTFDGYTFLPGAFAGGTFGEVTAGWAQDGSAVAIKRFKRPNGKQLSQHQKIMNLTGKHTNILELIHSTSNLEPAFPAIYCVYSPLALASLEDVVISNKINLSAQIALLCDYLRGLVYLHETKGIMHRDIKPSNLGVLSFSPPRGIILDLDAATTERTSDDHNQGTYAYLAPEIINLKMGSTVEQKRYGSSVDVWALGMSAFRALRGQHVNWNDYDDMWTRGRKLPGTEITDFVLEARLKRFHDRFEQRVITLGEHLKYFTLLQGMTMWDPTDRLSVSLALRDAGNIAARLGEATIVPRQSTQGTKRKIGES